MGFLLLNGFRYIFPALLPFFRIEFEMTLTTAGLVLTLLWLAYGVGQIPGGMIGDRIGERLILVSSCGFALGMVILITVSTTQVGFIIGAVGFGLALGLFSPSRMTVLTDLYPNNSGTAIGLNLGISSLGLTVLPVIAAGVAGVVGWRLGFGYVIPFIALVLIGLWITVPKRTAPAMTGGTSLFDSVLGPIKTLRNPPVLASLAAMIGMHFLFQAFSSFYPTYLVDMKGMSEQLAALVFGLIFALGLVIQPTSGFAGDRLGWRRTMLLIAIITIVGLVLLPIVESLVLIVVVTVLLSIQRGFWPIANAYLIDLFPNEIQSSGLGVSRTTYILLGSPGPIVVGVMADRGYFNEAFLLLAAIAGCSVLLILYLYRLD